MTRFLHVLSHPLVLLAAGLVALNDGWLKAAYPSWLTGKLSDAGVLVVLPLLLAGLLSACLERRRAGVLGLGLAGGAFILLKTGPQTAAWLSGLLGGFPLRSLPDPTDLLVLPVLAVPAWLWFRSPVPSGRGLSPRWRALLIPVLSAILLADAAMPDPGVSCLFTKDGQLRAEGGYYSVYASRDGGATWTLSEETRGDQPCGMPSDTNQALFSLPDGSTQFRVQKGGPVERSTDGGQTWQALDLREKISQPEETYILKTRSGNLSFQAAPLDALLDPASGNLLLAMGQQGVVIVRPDGSWQAAAVGSYARDSLKSAGLAGYIILLTGEMIFAALVGLAWLGTAGLRGRGKAWRVVTVLGWLALVGTALALHPEIADNSYTGIITLAGLIVSAALVLALVIGAVVARRGAILPKLPVALLVAVVTLLPYILWALGILPDYWIATFLAVGLGLAAAIWVK